MTLDLGTPAPALDDAHVARGTAHVEADGVPVAGEAGDHAGADGAARRPREHRMDPGAGDLAGRPDAPR